MIDIQLFITFAAQKIIVCMDNLNVVFGKCADNHEKYDWHMTAKICLACHRHGPFMFRVDIAKGFIRIGTISINIVDMFKF